MNERHEKSDVHVTFTDGEIKTYRISPGPGVALHLAQQSGETGTLVLLNGKDAFCIPVNQIREWHIRGVS